jgi:Cytotoxic translational repressor of toxin-antitoxin stability system
MKIYYNKKSLKYLKTLDTSTCQRIREAIKDFPLGDVVKLHGRKREYRLRVGNFRVLFEIEDDIIKIYKVSPRGQVYKGI